MKPRKFLAKEKNGTSKAQVEGKGEKPNDECHFKAKNLLSAQARTLEEGEGGIWSRESAWGVVSRPDSLPLPFRTPATQAMVLCFNHIRWCIYSS